MGRSLEVLHLIHSLDPKTGGVYSAVELLSNAMMRAGIQSRMSDDPKVEVSNPREWIIAHGLWQWPGRVARSFENRYLVYPHGMLDPWFKKTYPFKHLKKQIYWWVIQGKILRDAHAVCFTTQEEQSISPKTFFPYQVNEVLTGLGVEAPPHELDISKKEFWEKFPALKGRKTLLYLGRFHPKKGVDELIRSWKKRKHPKDEVLVLAGPVDKKDSWIQSLLSLAGEDPSVVWTGMLQGSEKWGALRSADAMILPSHQENYGMVVAEACSVGLPIYLTNQVNLWREVVDVGAGVAENDDRAGIQSLVDQWMGAEDRAQRSIAAKQCFEQRLHIDRTVENLCKIFEQASA
ncbi:MAG: glycosyltransferase [Verrucomicrobia bacterium]|nr:glycosyltransferase [Verrucomicrobiota bacterium]